MKNEKNIKQVSRLTGALLARKGAALPSPETIHVNSHTLNGTHKGIMPSRKKTVQSSTAGSVNAVKGKVSTRKSKPVKSSQGPGAHKRIAMTLRMEEENHLQLRLYSAHTRKSCQVILSEALDLYLAQNNDEVPLRKVASQNG
ncbi:MAG: hypothetical protein COB54_02160 [Alphaproteobacteria bacterium]|nr:MAG: hypothetical protein COB54_02160 [Alphaproteobacteria bacterium]